jgi:glycosyltransferase involved in cell wall biosynthesis
LKKKYSFIIPTYNRAHCILNTIESILNQTYLEYEIIVVDDGSTDDTKFILKSLFHNVKFKFFSYENNKGANYAKNFGAEKAIGDYLIFLDSDDILASSTSLDNINNELYNNNYPKISMFACKDLTNNFTISKINFKGVVSYQDYFIGKFKGEYLPIVNKGKFLQTKFFEEIIGGEGITWCLLTKKSGNLYISNTITRIYDNKAEDRLSYPNKKNTLRIRDVFIKDLKVNYKDYLSVYKIGFFMVIIKIIYYHTISFFK